MPTPSKFWHCLLLLAELLAGTECAIVGTCWNATNLKMTLGLGPGGGGDGRMEGMDGWMVACTDGWTDGVYLCVDGCVEVWMDVGT